MESKFIPKRKPANLLEFDKYLQVILKDGEKIFYIEDDIKESALSYGFKDYIRKGKYSENELERRDFGFESNFQKFGVKAVFDKGRSPPVLIYRYLGQITSKEIDESLTVTYRYEIATVCIKRNDNIILAYELKNWLARHNIGLSIGEEIYIEAEEVFGLQMFAFYT